MPSSEWKRYLEIREEKEGGKEDTISLFPYFVSNGGESVKYSYIFTY